MTFSKIITLWGIGIVSFIIICMLYGCYFKAIEPSPMMVDLVKNIFSVTVATYAAKAGVENYVKINNKTE